MNLDSTFSTSTKRREECDDDDEVEAERLHKTAFEQLRSSTQADQESFVERMRRWEAEQSTRAADESVEMLYEEPDVEGFGKAEGEEEDEVELMLDLGSSQSHPRSLAPVSGVEIDDLARRLAAGACELQDFSLVREVQARKCGRRTGRAEVTVEA